MVRPAAPVRYIKPETVCIGDRLKVTTPDEDTHVSVSGVVARRERDGQWTEYSTAKGKVLLRYHPAHKPPYTIRLVNRNYGGTPLEGL